MTEGELTAALRVLAVRPSPQDIDPELLEAYLEGTASLEDVTRVRELLAQSGELREELMGLAAITRGTLEFQTLPRPAVPPRRRKHGPFRSPQLIVGLAAVLAIAVGLGYGIRPRAGEPLALVADKAYYDEQFEVDALRGPAPPQMRLARNHREAALLAFRRRLRWIEGEIVVQEVPTPPASTEGKRTISIRTWAGTTYQALLPAEASDCRLAILSPPALSLSWANLPAEGERFRVPFPAGAETSSQVFLAVAYRTPAGMAAVLATPR
jgi:hypothetical protein